MAADFGPLTEEHLAVTTDTAVVRATVIHRQSITARGTPVSGSLTTCSPVNWGRSFSAGLWVVLLSHFMPQMSRSSTKAGMA